MPALKRLFGSPFGSHKKNKDHSITIAKSTVHKRNSKERAFHQSSSSTVTSSESMERMHYSSKEESSMVTRATLETDHNYQEDEDDFRSTVLGSLEVNNDPTDNNRGDHDDDDDDDDEFRTTILSSISADARNEEGENGDNTDHVRDDGAISDDDDDDDVDDFRTVLTSAHINAENKDDVNIDTTKSNSGYRFDEDDFRTTVSSSAFTDSGKQDGGVDYDIDNSNNDDDFRTTVLAPKSQDICSEDGVNGDDDDIYNFSNIVGDLYDDLPLADDDDFKTTIMTSASSECEKVDDVDHKDDIRLDYLPMADTKLIPKAEELTSKDIQDRGNVKNQIFDFESENYVGDESPVKAVEIGKKEDGGNRQSIDVSKAGPTSLMLPILSPVSAEDNYGGVDFDDHRSTISGLTEFTSFIPLRGASTKSFVPPSPCNSDAGTKKIEDFLKSETEALRQLLTTVESGDDESTVVEESNRVANEAERMAREMEREMKMLFQGNQGLLPSSSNDETMAEDEGRPNDQFSIHSPVADATRTTVYYPPQNSPDSKEYLANIRSVIHPTSDASEHRKSDSIDNKSMISSPCSLRSHRSSPSSTSRRDLFRKRPSLYKLKRKQSAKKLNRKKLKRLVRYTLRSLLLTLVVCVFAFVVNWQLNFSDQDFTDVTKSTVMQLRNHTRIDPKKKEEIMALAVYTSKATQSYIQSQMRYCAEQASSAKTMLVENMPTTEIEKAKQQIIEGLQRTSSFAISKTKHYAPIVVQQSKYHLNRGMKAINAFALDQLDTYIWTPDFKLHISEVLQATNQYVKDRLEYAFTDRAVREQKIQEELRLQRLMEAAAAAAAREAAEKQQQLWTQTMFAGACAFVGSVATNYIWAAL